MHFPENHATNLNDLGNMNLESDVLEPLSSYCTQLNA